ncbi:MAG: hypothetical protein EOP56_14230 [Sphingobacteriales bacterium]|nr:MAG: hypothetical protein EOP56_14230 [Sphingobacteriales bacterium]
MKYTLLLAIAAICFASCKQDKKDIIAKKWQATSLENLELEQKLKEQAVFIDTFGTHTDAATNMQLYGFTNIDSGRQAIRAEFEGYKQAQDMAVKNTWFNFRKDGVVNMNFGGQVDSANWYFDDEGVLILDEMKMKGTGAKILMEVKELTDKHLKLKFNEDGLTSTVSFVPAEK